MIAKVGCIEQGSTSKISEEEKTIYQFPLIVEYLKKKINGWSVGDLLKQVAAKKVILYSITLYTELIAMDICNTDTDIVVDSISDINENMIGNMIYGKKIISVDEAVNKVNMKDVDYILVCNVFREQEIINDLLQRGLDISRILTFTEMVCWQ